MGTETMKTAPFKPGDPVWCKETAFSSLQPGAIYEVGKAWVATNGKFFVSIAGSDVSYHATRFELVSIPDQLASKFKGFSKTDGALADAKEAIPDMVTTPNHYSRHAIEPIRFVTENYGAGFLVGNVIKYITRYDAKNGAEDLKKAARYLEMLTKFEAKDPDWYK